MMASPSELSLEFKPHSYSMLLKSFEQQIDQTQKLEEFLSRLQEERLKIDAFKRELPLCMQLLTNVMEAARHQLQCHNRANQVQQPVLEEFIPLKNSSGERSEKDPNISDKANWMTSAQLWSQASDGTKQQSAITSPKETDIGLNVSPKLALDNKQRNGGAFLPFSKDRNSCSSPTARALPDLALASNNKEMEDKKCQETDLRKDNSGKASNGAELGKGATPADSLATPTTTSQTHRKARRCWSPDLHRRFVNALQMLGGSQVATPKQIRELMKVDGLTNDEVKSHLQKYRLHTRRPGPSPQATATAAPQLVVLGGIWVPPEYTTATAGTPPTLYGVHPTTHAHASQHYCPAPVSQEFYSATPAPQQALHQLHHHPIHHQLQIYSRQASQNHGSLESDVRGVGDRSESIEDGKSESGSWKADSGGGENVVERKALVLRKDSEITLNF